MKTHKQGAELAFNTIIIAIIVLIAAFVIIGVFVSQSGKSHCVSDGLIDGVSEDCDGDGIKDAIDPCPHSKEGKDAEGKCPSTIEGECQKKIDKCKKK